MIRSPQTGTPEEQRCARKLLPLVQDVHPHHRLLVTLLLCNSVFNEALPLFLDKLVPSWAAVIVSVTMVLFFGEIIPSALFTGPNKLAIASSLAWLVRGMLCFLAPLAVPISALLDRLIPEETTFLSRNEVRALVAVQREIASEEGVAEPYDLTEENMIKGALSLSTLTPISSERLKPTSQVFTLGLDAFMDYSTMQSIIDHGHSRIPVHAPGDKSCFLGYILTKDHLMLDPRAATPLRDLPLYSPVVATPTLTLSALLQEFNQGTHIAFVAKDPLMLRHALDEMQSERDQFDQARFRVGGASDSLDPCKCSPTALQAIRKCGLMGIITLEDVIEVLLSEGIEDESDIRAKKILYATAAQNVVYKWMKRVAVPEMRKSLLSSKSISSPTSPESVIPAEDFNQDQLILPASPQQKSSAQVVGSPKHLSWRAQLRREASLGENGDDKLDDYFQNEVFGGGGGGRRGSNASRRSHRSRSGSGGSGGSISGEGTSPKGRQPVHHSFSERRQKQSRSWGIVSKLSNAGSTAAAAVLGSYTPNAGGTAHPDFPIEAIDKAASTSTSSAKSGLPTEPLIDKSASKGRKILYTEP